MITYWKIRTKVFFPYIKIRISGLRKHDISPAFAEMHKDQLRKPYLAAEAAVTDRQCQGRL